MAFNRRILDKVCHGFAMGLVVFLLTSATPTFAQRLQSESNNCSWRNSCKVPFPSNVAAGDSVAVAVSVGTWQTGPQTPTVTDSQANSYALVKSVGSTFLFCAPMAAAGPDSVISNLSIAQVQAMVILEFKGSCAVDQSATASGSSAAAASPSISVPAGDFLVAAATSKYNNTFHPSTGFTAEPGPGNLAIADAPQNSAGDLSVTFTLGSSTDWTALLVAFSPASSAGYDVTATLKWDDGTAVAGTLSLAQVTSTNPLTMNSLGSFPLGPNGVAKGIINPDLTLPLTFSVTLVNPSGAAVNSITLFANPQLLQGLPRTFSPSIVLAKSNADVNSVSF